MTRCDACDKDAWLYFSPDHGAHFCWSCYVKNMPHGREYAGTGPDDGTDRGAYCPACSHDVRQYVWPCVKESS